MAASVKSLHAGRAAQGAGGFANMTQADHGRVGGLLKTQYRYLNNFATQVAADPDLVLGAAGRQDFDSRVSLYGDAGVHTYEAVRLQGDLDAGLKWEYNILEPGAVHCHGKPAGCIEQSGRGVVKAGVLVAIGRRLCLGRCRCHIDRFATKKAAVAAWRALAGKAIDFAREWRVDDGCTCGAR